MIIDWFIKKTPRFGAGAPLGDNCHRGAVLGAVLGAALGLEAIPERWVQGLTAHAALTKEIDHFFARFS